ncbi:MAG: hypothetical protein QN174_06010 [Armatimonadota bacterium]|nr:hypothetical protein [Armatimonadota bacterium]MDR7453506.1 hypothetical protein [Armatimonadota bacterium]MDR7456971.1 hypothetical protein [Armatimonadota bacterium]MDR7496494.1 hypothetical protein [Armatimonadota bacterium]MDR7511587.1 hypothetical protein [Armatimonadota bacterium]
MVTLADLTAGARLLWSLPWFLRSPVDPEHARAVLRTRLQRRDADFLDLMRRTVFAGTSSPYRALLSHAGCEYGDLAAMVRRDGVEGALHALYRRGVYLTADEFKGRRPLVRGSLTLTVHPAQFANPLATVHVPTQSSGSRGERTAAGIDLAHLRDQAVGLRLFLDARGARRWVHAHCGVPGGSAVHAMLRLACAGLPPHAWFSHVDPATPELHPRYRWSVRVVRWGSWLGGQPFGSPRHVRPDDPRPILKWIAQVRRRGLVPHLRATPSTAVLVCQAALDAGVDISGTEFTAGGEPLTTTRAAVGARAGARIVPQYASVESGHIAYGCLAPAAADDHHVLSDLQAIIQPGERADGAGLPPEAILLTSLRASAPFILLNVSSGDVARVEERACGCPLEALGWRTHLQAIRGYEKLTAGGMTFLDTDLVRVLEEVLPARFGGGPTHYQLVEEEGPGGRPLLRLLVHPAVGPVDPGAVADAFLAAIGAGPGPARVMELFWRGADMLRVERAAPLLTATGKILHLHHDRRQRVNA